MREGRAFFAGIGLVSLLAGCAGCAGNDDGSAAAKPAPPLVTSGSPDAGTFTFAGDASVEGGALLSPCDPTSPSSCSTGFTCYAQHTSASWWVDLYGTCTFACNSQTLALCDSLDGVCGCPEAQAGTAGGAGACSADGGGASMVCVPALKPGTAPGANDGEGGCGTPGCGGGGAVEAGSLATDAAGD